MTWECGSGLVGLLGRLVGCGSVQVCEDHLQCLGITAVKMIKGVSVQEYTESMLLSVHKPFVEVKWLCP